MLYSLLEVYSKVMYVAYMHGILEVDEPPPLSREATNLDLQVRYVRYGIRAIRHHHSATFHFFSTSKQTVERKPVKWSGAE